MKAGAVCPRMSGEAIRALRINTSSHAILIGSEVSTKSGTVHRAGFDDFRFGAKPIPSGHHFPFG
jgi:hypothetical protein